MKDGKCTFGNNLPFAKVRGGNSGVIHVYRIYISLAHEKKSLKLSTSTFENYHTSSKYAKN